MLLCGLKNVLKRDTGLISSRVVYQRGRGKEQTHLRLGLAGALLAVVITTALLSPSAAKAGTYEVVSCLGNTGNASWVPVSNTAAMGTGDHCPTDGNGWDGLLTHTQPQAGSTSNGQLSAWVFQAPSGTQIGSVSYHSGITEATGKYSAGMYAQTGGGSVLLAGCPAGQGCINGGWFPNSLSAPAGTTQLASMVICQSASCPLINGSLAAYYAIKDVTVTVDDYTYPSIGNDQGSLATSQWIKGTGQVSFQSSDSSGIKNARVTVDGIPAEEHGKDCNKTLRSPCAANPSDTFTVSTAAFTDGSSAKKIDGPHTLAYKVVDAGGNETEKTRTVYWDNHAPLSPTNLTVVGGEDWRSQNGFNVTWNNFSQGQAAPIAKTHYKLCKAGGSCQTNSLNGAPTSNTFNLPSGGQYTLQLWLEDAAGNVNSDAPSGVVNLRYDPTAPGRAEPEKTNGWIGITEAKTFSQSIKLYNGIQPPLSGIKGYSVTTDGSDPDSTVEVFGQNAAYPMALKEGLTVVKARSVSNANLGSNEVGSTELRVDLQRPSVSMSPDLGEGWHNEPVEIQVEGVDQAILSGMKGAPDDRPADEGAYIAYRLDGGAEEQVRGGKAKVAVGEDGYHSLTVKAVDLAGNESAEQTVKFKVDRSAPEIAVFERVNLKDPRAVSVAVADALSGVETGRVEFRPLGSNGKWQQLPTRLEGDHLQATFVDDDLPDGLYELRAVVKDMAGNTRISSDSRDGVSAVRTSPARDVTHLRSAILAKLAKKCRKVKKRTKSGRRKLVKRCKTSKAKTTTVLKIQEKSVALAGKGERLLTSKTDKNPIVVKGVLLDSRTDSIDNTQIEVQRLVAAKGTSWERIGQTDTDSQGRFSYRYSGPSALLRFVYGGSLWRDTAQDQVRVTVPARVSLKTSRKFIRNGRTLRFSGKLLGKPLAGRGKLVELQAVVRGKWRTFGTTRTDSKGRWRYRYRFEVTYGRLKYRFRIRVRPEDGYPYSLGYSQVKAVIVQGPKVDPRFR